MDYEEEPFTFDRTDSFPIDRAYPSRSTRSQIPKRPTGDSLLLDDRHLHRGGTDDFEPRRRLRYTVPLRRKSNHTRDEEKGYIEEKSHSLAYSPPLGIEREASRGSAAFPPPEFLEIISTKWVPDDEGREIVTLTVKDAGGKIGQEQVRCESRWKHIQSDAMTLREFYRQVMRTPGLGDDDMALVARLLNKVQNTSEKKFVHGRYLKPIILVYEGEDPDVSAPYPPEEKHVRKTATFISLPVFTTCCLKRHTSTKDFEGHPVRALLQSRYRLESTKRRDKEQVITKTTSIREHLAHEDHVVHVPQVWALIINNYTIITCAALDASVLRSDTIKLISYTAAQQDEATWSVHFTDARGKDFYLPLRYCKTWFDLVRQITDNCLNDEYSFIRDQLLKGGPVYQLVVANDGSAVNAEKWSKLVEATKTEVIHIRLVDNESMSSRLLITYCDDEGNDVILESDNSTDTSSTFSSDAGEDSDASESSVSSNMSFDKIAPAIDRLRSLQAKLREADGKGDTKKAEDLKEHKIPALEDKLLELNAAGLNLDAPTTRHARERSRIIIPGPYNQGSRSSHGLDHDSPLSPTERYRARLRSRSRSMSKTRSIKRDVAFSSSANDLSFEEPLTLSRASQPSIAHDKIRSDSRNRIFRDVDYGIAPPVRSHMRSHMPSAHSLSRTSTLHDRSRSGWDLVRSRVRDRELPRLQNSPISPLTDSRDVYYRPSEKLLARSYWDLVRSSVLDGGIHKLRNMEAAKKDDELAKAGVATTTDSQKRGLSGPEKLPDVLEGSPNGSSTKLPSTLDPPASFGPPEAPLHVPANGISSVNQDQNDPTKRKKVLFSKHSLESKPKLKRLIKLAHKESGVLPNIATSPSALEVSSPVSADLTTDVPIFLWSAEHKQSESRDLARKLPQLPNLPEAPTFKSFIKKPAEEIKRMINTSKTEELILHTVMTELHIALKKPKKGKPEYAVLYEKTAEKTYASVAISMNTTRNATTSVTNVDATDGRNTDKRASHFRRPSLAFVGESLRQINSIRSVASTSGQDDLGSIKIGVFDLASRILLAFVPKGYDAPVLSKYWGALHKLLNEKDEDVLRYVRSRLSEICSLVQSIQMGVRAEDGSKQQRYQIPRALPAAFQHLVLLLVVISSTSNWSEYSWSQMQSTFDDCEGLLVEGRKQLLLMIHTDDYRDSSGFQAVDSEALVSLILANLISTMSTEGDFHLTEVYAEYTTKIQSIVRDSASVKVYDDIKLLREELDIIKNTLRQQYDTLREFKSTITLTYGVLSLSVSILDRILESISQRIEDFDELQIQAETARFLAAQSISLKAESNNKAIIVFTVVTIIFLPLSFVTSYLGMNTSDLRDMKSGQRLFWAIGAPVAFVVLGAALMAAFYGTLTQRLLGRAWRGKEKGE